MFMKVLDAAIFIICLPVYLIAWPFMLAGQQATLKKLRKIDCPRCGQEMSGLDKGDVYPMMARLRITAGTIVDWEHMPKVSVVCPNCNQKSCFDAEYRQTSCEYSDHIRRIAK